VKTLKIITKTFKQSKTNLLKSMKICRIHCNSKKSREDSRIEKSKKIIGNQRKTYNINKQQGKSKKKQRRLKHIKKENHNTSKE
jgi:hypothetical protein